MRLTVLFARLGPYHVARLRAAGAEADVTALELSGRVHEYAWDPVDAAPGFERVTLFPDEVHRAVPRPRLQRRLDAALDAAAPDVVALPGWADPGALAALRWCRTTDTPTVVMSASSAQDAPRVWWREAVKRRVLRLVQAGLGGGTPHAAYLRALGLPDDRVFTGYNVVDNAHFARGARAAQSDADARRDALDLPARYFVAINRFVPKKNLARLLDAYAAYRARRGADAWSLVLLGDGPLRDDLARRVRARGLDDAVRMPGFQQYPDLPAYYGLADAFVHASTTEQWGLVVNEAMAAGLPVIVSDRCGCVTDLVDDGRNGFTFDPYDVDALTQHLLTVSGAACDRDAMAAASRSIIDRWRPERFGTALRRAAEAARAAPRPSFSWIDSLLLRWLIR